MKSYPLLLIFTLLIQLALVMPANASDTSPDGKALFTTNCKACHSLDMRLVGPPLKGVTDRRDSLWLRKFIRSSQTLVKEGDPVAVELFNEYNQVIMPDQPLEGAEIDAILEYVQTGGTTVAEDNKIPRPVVDYGEVSSPLDFTHYSFWIPYTVTVLLLIALLWYMAEVSSITSGKESSDEAEEA